MAANLTEQCNRVVRHLQRRAATRKLARRISSCRKGKCLKCGDVCPTKGDFWLDENMRSIKRLLQQKPDQPVWRATFTRDIWARDRKELGASPLTWLEREARRAARETTPCTLDAIKKTFRRALDKLDTGVVAVGIIDAWYGPTKQWDLGISFLISGADRTEIRLAFPAGVLSLEPVGDLAAAVRSLFQSAREAKPSPFLQSIPPWRQYEYYRWLSRMKWNERLFRYGCDRHFNTLDKPPRKPRPQRKRHPYPFWLEPCMFGNHPMNCQCHACGGLGRQESLRTLSGRRL